MIEYKNGKEYWKGHECTDNFIFRTLADMFPQDYERYQIESLEFKKNHIVFCCSNCGYKLVLNNPNTSDINCPSCKSTSVNRIV